MTAVGKAARPVRVAVMSDCHMEQDYTIRGRCRVCGDVFVAARAKEFKACGCGMSQLDAGDGHMCRVGGEVEILPRREKSWGECAREAGADLVVLAGDIHKGAEAVAFAAEEFAGLPTVLVPGNHEYYGGDIVEVRRAMAEAAKATANVRLLDRGAAVFRVAGRRVRVLGCTLWTNYAALAPYGLSQREAMEDAERGMRDHRRITIGGKPFTAPQALRLHRKDVLWLERRLAKPFDGLTVVATHHAPVLAGLHPAYVGRPGNAAFVSDLADLLWRGQPDLVVWGHTHSDADLRRGKTRLVSSQRGYSWEGRHGYEPAVVEIG